jgi:hypothetical protein
VDAAKARNFLGLLSLVIASAYIAMFHLDLSNNTVVVFLKLVSAGMLPGLLCFSWLYFWVDAADPFRYLAVWNSCTQVLFLAVNLLRIPAASWGVFGWAYIAVSGVVIVFYLTRFHDTRWGFFALGGLILLNVVLAFALTLTTYSLTHPVIAASEREAVRYLGVFVSELAVMGALFTSSSQLYWHEILGKRREQALVEGVFQQLEEKAIKMSPDDVAGL